MHSLAILEGSRAVPGEWNARRQEELRHELLRQLDESIDITIRKVEVLAEAGVRFRTFFSEVQ